MFKLKAPRAYAGTMHRIVSDRVVLDAADGYDLIFTGLNAQGYRVVTGMIDDDLDRNFARYYAAIINPKLHSEFLNHKAPLLRILQESHWLFLVDIHRSGKEIKAYSATLGDIPPSALPRPWAMCPDLSLVPTLEYTAIMFGKLAEKGQSTKEGFDDFTEAFMENIKRPYHKLVAPIYSGFTLNVNYAAISKGSFEVGFVAEIVPKSKKQPTGRRKQTEMFKEPAGVEAALSSLYRYVLSDLDNEHGIDVESTAFKGLEKNVASLYLAAAKQIPDNLQDDIVNTVKETLISFSEIDVDNDFDGVEISNRDGSGADVTVGVIDADYVESISELAQVYINEKSPDRRTDDYPIAYTFHVFAFNNETGKGAAYLQTTDTDGGKRAEKIKIYATGLDSYEGTTLSGSLDDGKVITKEGVATHVDGKVKSILFDLSTSR